MKLYREKSLISELVKIVMVTLLFAILGIASLLGISYMQERISAAILERNEISSCIHIVLSRMESSFKEYSVTEDQQNLDTYEFQKLKAQEYIDTLIEMSQKRPIAIAQLQKISDSMRQQERMMNTYTNTATDETFTSVLKGLEDMKMLVQTLVIDDLQTSWDEYVEQMERLTLVKTLITAIVAVIVVLGYIRIYLKIRDIRHAMRMITHNSMLLAEGKFDTADMDKTPYQEFNTVGRAMDDMKRKIVLYLEEEKNKSALEDMLRREQLANAQKDKQIAKAQLESLKQQINPHFLFNALNIIGKSTVLGNPEYALMLIESISKILRYSLEKAHEQVTLRDDMEIVEAYLSLQKARFPGTFTYELDIAEPANQVHLCPMLIQPLIENSIKHGKQDYEILHILIGAQVKDKQLIIYVEDNGQGFHVEKMQSNGKFCGVGLNNVKDRIDLTYENLGDMKVESVPGEGTKVTLFLPMLEG